MKFLGRILTAAVLVPLYAQADETLSSFKLPEGATSLTFFYKLNCQEHQVEPTIAVQLKNSPDSVYSRTLITLRETKDSLENGVDFALPLDMIQAGHIVEITKPSDKRCAIEKLIPAVEMQQIDLVPSSGINILHINYKLGQKGAQRLGVGFVKIGNRHIRFNMTPDRSSEELILSHGGVSNAKARIFVDIFNEDKILCPVLSLQANLQTLSAEAKATPDATDAEVFMLALLHAPFLGSRLDLLYRPWDDVPLVTGYAWMPNETAGFTSDAAKGGYSLVYTVIFSDQNAAKETIEKLDEQIAVWSRRTDIEWNYKIPFDKNGTPLFDSDTMLGHVTMNMAVSESFDGEMLEGTSQPIVTVSSLHNSFDDDPINKNFLIGYHHVPRVRVEYPLPREEIMFRNPWTMKLSDMEIAERGALKGLSTDYMYFRITGTTGGSFSPNVTIMDEQKNSTQFFVGSNLKSHSKMKHLGKNLWNKSSYATIYLGKERIDQVLNGSTLASFNVRGPGEANVKMDVEKIEAFRIKADEKGAYYVEDVSGFFYRGRERNANSRLITKVRPN